MQWYERLLPGRGRRTLDSLFNFKKKPLDDIRTCTEVNISRIKRQSTAKARKILDRNSREGLPVLYFDTKDEDTTKAREGDLLHQRGQPGLPEVQQRSQQAPQPGKKKSN